MRDRGLPGSEDQGLMWMVTDNVHLFHINPLCLIFSLGSVWWASGSVCWAIAGRENQPSEPLTQSEVWQQPRALVMMVVGAPTMFTSFTATHQDPFHHLGLFPVHGSYGHSLCLCLRPSQRCGNQGGGGVAPVSVSGWAVGYHWWWAKPVPSGRYALRWVLPCLIQQSDTNTGRHLHLRCQIPNIFGWGKTITDSLASGHISQVASHCLLPAPSMLIRLKWYPALNERQIQITPTPTQKIVLEPVCCTQKKLLKVLRWQSFPFFCRCGLPRKTSMGWD